ncbi:serine/arginine repetitive matrix protein 4 [Hemicordylus capensis]|uniref:serine/arginine repetitive matrix protein 4 n=1 Tax=Hemicordylus capensis TaxID=884348 RepID=UPI002303629B|nr:serine/arginine repetitive matrix protein 4 [Hemicordylus capensis]
MNSGTYGLTTDMVTWCCCCGFIAEAQELSKVLSSVSSRDGMPEQLLTLFVATLCCTCSISSPSLLARGSSGGGAEEQELERVAGQMLRHCALPARAKIPASPPGHSHSSSSACSRLKTAWKTLSVEKQHPKASDHNHQKRAVMEAGGIPHNQRLRGLCFPSGRGDAGELECSSPAAPPRLSPRALLARVPPPPVAPPRPAPSSSHGGPATCSSLSPEAPFVSAAARAAGCLLCAPERSAAGRASPPERLRRLPRPPPVTWRRRQNRARPPGAQPQSRPAPGARPLRSPSQPAGQPPSPPPPAPLAAGTLQHPGERRAPAMASVQQGEKQLFEKFWRGTFKAVATPRPGSVIVASITARRKPLPRPSTETPSSHPSLPAAEKHPEETQPAQETSRTNGCSKLKGSQEQHPRNKSHSPSCDEDFPPPPARGKKKKKKSARKKRRRSPSYSPSPVKKKKKKKKKKNSKKRKRSRLSSKKRRRSSSSPKSRRKDGKKHKKNQPRKSQRHHHCRSGSSSLPESGENRPRARPRENAHKARWKRSRRSPKSARKPGSAPEVTATPPLRHAPQHGSFLAATGGISESGSSADLFKKAESHSRRVAKQNGEPHEYDSGNDTSSPPSTQTSSSRSKGSQEANGQGHEGVGRHAFSSGKTSSDSSSDSGNSFTSCVSHSKGASLANTTPSPCLRAKEHRPCFRHESSTSRSSPESGHSRDSHPKAGPRSSQSRSCSSGTRSYSRSSSYSSKSCKRSPGSRSSRPWRSPSYSRYSPNRDRDHKYGSSGKTSHKHHDGRRRKQSYSPMRKRRRDSPSHLEARRITSARKRPIPYYRPSPSSSSRSSLSSSSSWSSSFSRSRSSRRSSSRSSKSWSSSRSSHSSDGSQSRSSGAARNSRSSKSSFDSLRH